MNIRLMLLSIYIPRSLKQKKLKELFRLTADAFECPLPAGPEELTHMELLESYARFAAEQARNAVKQGRQIPVLKQRLFKNACEFGQNLRSELGIHTIRDLMLAGKLLYGVLKISFEGNAKGEVVIRQCFFSRFFSEAECDIISTLDEGVAAGLSGGGKLTFTQRITEGKECCRARLAADTRL